MVSVGSNPGWFHVYSHLELLSLCPILDLDIDDVLFLINLGLHVTCRLALNLNLATAAVHPLTIVRNLEAVSLHTGVGAPPFVDIIVAVKALRDVDRLAVHGPAVARVELVRVEADGVVDVSHLSAAHGRLCGDHADHARRDGAIEVHLDYVRELDVAALLGDPPSRNVDRSARPALLVGARVRQVVLVVDGRLDDDDLIAAIVVEVLLHANNVARPDEVRGRLHDRVEFVRVGRVARDGVAFVEAGVPVVRGRRRR